MVFSSLLFIFRFMPVFFIIYYAVPVKWKNAVLFCGSIVFYAWGEPRYAVLVLISIAVNFLLARGIDRAAGRHGRQKFYMALDIFYNVGLLLVFKYSAFAVNNVNSIFGTSFDVPSLTLPLGISFYTFQIMSYVIDVYRGTCCAERSILDLGTYLLMFPQLIAGPIVMYDRVALSLKARQTDTGNIERGLKTFILGLGSKVLLANNFGNIWNAAGTAGYDVMSTPMAWIGIISYTFQIYFDFNGYSLMAIGLGEMLGFNFPQNFNFPYIASSVNDFWHRWHITLTTWFREYIYIPLGGNRKGEGRTYLNMLIVWAVTGFWHGADWNFVLWGLYYFVLLSIERLFLGKILKKFRILPHIYTLVAVMCGWVLFAITDIKQVGVYLSRMFTWHSGTDYKENIRTVLLLIAAGAIFSTPVFRPWYRKHKNGAAVIMVLFMIFWASVTALVDSVYNPFLYFRF